MKTNQRLKEAPMIDRGEHYCKHCQRSFFIKVDPEERIQFMIGKNPEHPGGGFGEGPLADFIEGVLKEHRSY